jgi:hypothetical protein
MNIIYELYDSLHNLVNFLRDNALQIAITLVILAFTIVIGLNIGNAVVLSTTNVSNINITTLYNTI